MLIESIHKTIDRLSRPVAAAEELDLEPSEEPFHRGVVGRAALLRQGTRFSVSLAPLNPAGPTVMAASDCYGRRDARLQATWMPRRPE